jgi:hypothetical protein
MIYLLLAAAVVVAVLGLLLTLCEIDRRRGWRRARERASEVARLRGQLARAQDASRSIDPLLAFRLEEQLAFTVKNSTSPVVALPPY